LSNVPPVGSAVQRLRDRTIGDADRLTPRVIGPFVAGVVSAEGVGDLDQPAVARFI